MGAGSKNLHEALKIHVGFASGVVDLGEMFEEAADARDDGDKTYNTKLGSMMIRILLNL